MSAPEKTEPVKKPKPVSLDHVRSALNESKEQRDKRIKKLFTSFDSNNDGYLDSSKIEKGLSQMRIPSDYKFAKELLKVCDKNQDGRVDFDEFRKYTDDKEMELFLIFQAIDADYSGSILPDELLDALGKAGIEMNDNELAKFVDRIDKDNNGIITFEEWRDFLLLCPHEATIKNIHRYWEKVYLVDIGESAVIPEGISKHLHATKYLIAGGIAGAASRTATAPLDRLKVILQVQTKKAAIGPAIQTILKEGGLLGFFRGNGLNVFKVTPESAIKFYAYESFKNVIGDADANGNVGNGGRLVAGGLAGAVAQTFIYPMDLVKTRLQTFDGRAPGLAKLTRDIWIQEGPRAFYRGLFPSLIGIIPYAGIDLSAYETLKEMSKKYIHQDSEPGPLVPLACGMLSGSIGAMSVYPLQVIRTRMQAQRMKSTMAEVFWRTYRNEGPRGFYKGLFPNLLKVVPAASITYTVYEATKKSLDLQ